MIFAVSIASIYGYWAGEVNRPEDNPQSTEITIGEGQEVNTQLDVTAKLEAEGKNLYLLERLF